MRRKFPLENSKTKDNDKTPTILQIERLKGRKLLFRVVNEKVVRASRLLNFPLIRSDGGLTLENQGL